MTDEQLREFSSTHLCYEINSLYSALELFAKSPSKDVKTLEDAMMLSAKNLFLEGVIVHTRCLYEFLYGKPSTNPKHKDDALAIHYFEDSTKWETLRPKDPSPLHGLSERAGKEVAHLTYTRMTISEIAKRWDLYTITNDLLTTLILFGVNAGTKKLHSDVNLTLEFWKKRTEYEPGQTALTSATATAGSSSFSVGMTGATMPVKNF